MSTLDGPIWSRCSIALTWPAWSHFQCTQSRERLGQGWDERWKNVRAGEKKKRKQTTDFKEAGCCPTAVVQGAA